MIIDKETNKVYFSYLSKYDFKKELHDIQEVLKKHTIEWDYIHGTKDYFCRDYMPVQVREKHLVQFKFYPDYLLKPDRLQFFTKTQQVHKKNIFLNDFDITFSDIILDGGNIVKWNDKVIITDKIFTDNNNREKSKIIEELEKLLECTIIIIPAYPEEETGHADGLVRFIDENTVLTYNLEIESGKKLGWEDKFMETFQNNNITVKMLPAVSKKEDYKNWAYLNFLQVNDVIILPVFNRESDEVMIHFFKETFNTTIETVYSQNILDQGGVLNCFTWSIKQGSDL